MKIPVLIFAALLSLMAAGCKKEKSIEINSSDFMTITPDLQWAVISVPYAAFLETCSYDASVKSHGRGGDVLLVTGKEFVRKPADENSSSRNKSNNAELETWYKFTQGCISSSYVKIYDTKQKAETASKEFVNSAK